MIPINITIEKKLHKDIRQPLGTNYNFDRRWFYFVITEPLVAALNGDVIIKIQGREEPLSVISYRNIRLELQRNLYETSKR